MDTVLPQCRTVFRSHALTGHRVPTCRRGSVGANSTTTFRSHAPTGHRIPAQGANPGNPPGKGNPRSEGTPHSCMSRISTPTFPMRCSFRTHLFSRMRFPGLAPWAGMRCPLQGNLWFLGRCPAWYALPRWGNLNNGISDPAPMPQRGIAYLRVGAAPLEPIDRHVSDAMP